MTRPERYANLTARQHALATRSQLMALGYEPHDIARRIARGILEEVTGRVLRVGGSPHTPHQAAMAAVLDSGPGAVLARSSALALWGLPSFELTPLHVLRDRSGRAHETALATIHTTVRLDAEHVMELYGIPVSSPVRALVDLAGVVSYGRLERICDWAWSRRLLTGTSLHEAVATLAIRGRPGVAKLRALAEARPIGYRPPESSLEARAAEILASAGERGLQAQVDLGDDDWIGRVDLVDLELRVVVEIQSDLFHTSVSDRERDRLRRERLRAAGWIVIEVAEFDVWHRPDRFLAAVRQARAEARRRRAA